MNLGELLARTGVELRHDPQSTSERNNRAVVLNEEYMRLCEEARWSFLQKTETITVYPDAHIWWGVPGGVGWFRYYINPLAITALPDELTVGAEVTAVDSAGDDRGPFEADRWDNATGTLYTGDTGTLFGAVILYEVTLRQRIKLPVDCIEVLGIVSREDERGPLRMIDLPSEQEMMLNDDDSGEPDVYMVSPPQQLDRSPYATLVGAEVAAASAYVVGRTYRYFYAYYFAGRYSGRSNIVEITQTAAINNHRLSGWEAWAATQRGTLRHVFRADGPDMPFRYVTSITYTHAGNLDIASTTIPNEDQPWVDSSPAQYLRLWPRVAEDYFDVSGGAVAYSTTNSKDYELRYRYRPARLAHDLDVPHLPEVGLDVLVNRTVERLAMQRGDKDLAAFARNSHREKYGIMRNRYLTSTAQNRRFRRWTDPLDGSRVSKTRITRLP